jgi:integrase
LIEQPGEPMEASALTLRALYERAYLPNYLTAAHPRTMDAYASSLAAWEKHTENPPVGTVNTCTLAAFKAATSKAVSRVTKRSTSPATVNKHLRHIGAILSKAGPPGPRNRDAMGLLEHVPWVKPFKLPRRRPATIAQDHLAAIYAACQHAIHPVAGDVPAATWWRSLIVCAYNVGIRREALLGLRWADVDLMNKIVRVPAELDKCGTEREKPICTELMRHLVMIRGDRERVWPWTASDTTFYRQWHELQDLAGLAPANHHKLHDLKRTCGTELGRTSNALVVRDMLDHSTMQMASAYVDTTEPLRAAAERMRQPWIQRSLFA